VLRRVADGEGDGVTWEYMTWATSDTKAGRSVRLVNGGRLDEYRLEHPALVEAGEQGWELVAVVAAGAK